MTPLAIVRIDRSFERWQDLLDLILASFAYMNSRIDPPSSALQLTPASLRDKAAQEIDYVALDGEELFGCIFLRPEPDCLYIGKLAVLPSAQGRGFGRRLLEVAEETARGLGLAALRLETRIELEGNHATFSDWGFVRMAEKSHPGFTRVTFVEMRKVVGGA